MLDPRLIAISICCLLAFTDASSQEKPPQSVRDSTLSTLAKFASFRSSVQQRIKEIENELKTAISDSAKKQLQSELEQLEKELQEARDNFADIAAGMGLVEITQKQDQSFNLQAEVLSLMEPVVREMKHMTSDVRKRSELREEIAFYSDRVPKARSATETILRFVSQTDDAILKEHLQDLLDDWLHELANMESKLQTAQLQLDRIERAQTSFAERSQNYLKSFFRQRGLYLAEALGVVLAVLLLSRLSHKLIMRVVPGYRQKHRSFRIRLLDLVHRMVTIILAIMGPMVVFYIAEDWVLFSLGILLLLGAAWTLRTAVPRYWQQIRIYLNIGSVREGERIDLDGLPWKVMRIDIFTTLENATAGIMQRIAIENLVELKSRPMTKTEPWFPCRRDDWVLLNDGTRGKVIGISQELVELVERGGARKTYVTQEFLGQAPRNLSVNFRLKETIGISYDLQASSTTTILETLKAYLMGRIEAEGYADDLMNLQVEFQSASTSSLDLVVIADFRGEMGPLYNRLRRAIQRWSVDACTENNWEIPFTQLTLHNRPEKLGPQSSLTLSP